MALPPVRIPITAQDKTAPGFRSAKRGMQGLGNSTLKLAGQLGALTGAAGFGLLISQQFQAQDALAKTADKLDITETALQGLRNAGQQYANVSGQTIDTALQRLTRRLSEAAQGTGEARGAIIELGLDAQKLSTLTLEQQFTAITKAFGDVESQADKVRLAFKLFDTEGVALVNVMNAGADAVEAAKVQVQQYGQALDAPQALGIQQANDALLEARIATTGLAAQLSSSLAPSVIDAANAFSGWVAYLTGTAIPAFKLLAEQFGLIELNANALSYRELQVRTVSLQDTIDDLNTSLEKLEATSGRGRNNSAKRIAQLREEIKLRQDQLADVEAQIEERRKTPAAGGDAVDVTLDSGAKTFAQQQAELQRQREAVAKAGEEKRAASQAQSLAERLAREEESYQQGLQNELEAIESRFLTTSEAEIKASEARQQILANSLSEGLLTWEQYNALVEKEAQRSAARLEEIERQSSRNKTLQVIGGLKDITAATATGSRKIFELNKALALAEAAVTLPKTVMDAYAAGVKIGGPVVGALYAATAGAAQISQISQIRSASFGGGTTPSLAGSAPSIGGFPVTGGGSESQQVTRAETTGTVINVNLSGIEDDGLYSGTAVRRLIEAFTEQIREGSQTEFLGAITGG